MNEKVQAMFIIIKEVMLRTACPIVKSKASDNKIKKSLKVLEFSEEEIKDIMRWG